MQWPPEWPRAYDVFTHRAAQCAYALELGVKMADEEAEKDRGPENDVSVVIVGLKRRLQELQEVTVKESQDSPVQSSFNYCQDFCRVSSLPCVASGLAPSLSIPPAHSEPREGMWRKGGEADKLGFGPPDGFILSNH